MDGIQHGCGAFGRYRPGCGVQGAGGDLLIKKSPITTWENHAHEYELSNHINTAYNTLALARFLRTGAFYIFKNFSQNLSKSLANFRRVELRGTKGEVITRFRGC